MAKSKHVTYSHLTLSDIPAVCSPAERIIWEVAVRHHVTPAVLRGPIRTKRVVWARAEAVFRLSTERNLSTPIIGRLFNRDHTSILYLLRKFTEQMAPMKPDHRNQILTAMSAIEAVMKSLGEGDLPSASDWEKIAAKATLAATVTARYQSEAVAGIEPIAA